MNQVFAADDLRAQVSAASSDLLGRARNAAGIAAAAALVMQFAETAAARHLSAEQSGRIACTAGCGTCCAVNVAVLVPEVVAIAAYLRRTLSPNGLRDVSARVAELSRLVSGLEDDERILMRRSCALLDENGACAIYPVRPLLCRSITSTDAENCREAFVAPAFGEDAPVLMNLLQKSLFESAFAGLGDALHINRLDARSSKLACVLNDFLHRPERIEDFLAGRPVAAQ